ncbi:hypothetical protein NEF87_004583 [Candidatus Lokiarchaeum ossiferum]|uniref:Isoprenylcysteine carboxylmethyltransferase family protein n=1 Tax=Candidatus Lokiarchaeum ossiferum TaxID=2951803 RepID=A0ABY6HXP3_9ARCH|nr:hypothetical protein NEF87_004583 [Candidatus Lokiarchaeum sp. B-35]
MSDSNENRIFQPSEKAEKKNLYIEALKKSLFVFILLGIMFFLPSWSLRYWEAWLYIGTFMIMMNIFLIYLVNKDPDLLKRRLKRKEKREPQKWIITVANVILLLMYLFPSIDNRFNWSKVPTWTIFVADFILIGSYGLFIWILHTNRYASHTVEVEKGTQKLITTGPYAIVRHPMYFAVAIMYGITPLALGSWWGLLGIILFIPLLILRILDEEKMLIEELEGYEEYMKKTKYRVIPGIF